MEQNEIKVQCSFKKKDYFVAKIKQLIFLQAKKMKMTSDKPELEVSLEL